ncbi:unnamed protein product, partial [Prorocentrum cordatum]
RSCLARGPDLRPPWPLHGRGSRSRPTLGSAAAPRGADGGRARGPDGGAEAPSARRVGPAAWRAWSGAGRGAAMAAAIQARGPGQREPGRAEHLPALPGSGTEEDMAHRSLRTSPSAPALLPARASLEVAISEPPSAICAEWRTTVVFRNVPYLLTRDMLVELLDSQGFRGQFNLVYMPMDFKTNQALGYAFVNAASAEVAIRLFGVFDGFQAWPKKSSKVCNVCWGSRQGLESNLDAYRKLTVMRTKFPDAWKPAFFSQGIQVPFPKRTREITRNLNNLRGGGDPPRL